MPKVGTLLCLAPINSVSVSPLLRFDLFSERLPSSLFRISHLNSSTFKIQSFQCDFHVISLTLGLSLSFSLLREVITCLVQSLTLFP